MANVYGSHGNRWYVGLNTRSSQSTIFGTASFLSPNGYESLPAGNAADDAKFAAAAAQDRSAGTPVVISVEGVTWFNIQGPFPTQAAANAAIPSIQQAHPAAGEAQQVANAVLQGNGQTGANTTPAANPLSGLAAIGAFFASLGQSGTWVRVAKVIIGGVLVVVGIARMTGAGAAAEKAVGAALP